MDVQPPDSFRRRIGIALGISLIAHVLLGVVTVALWKMPSRAAWLRQGEPLMVDLQSLEPEAPHGNPASRGGPAGPPGPPAKSRAPRPSPPAARAPRVASAPSASAPSKPPAPKPVTPAPAPPKVASAAPPPVPRAPSPPPEPTEAPVPKPAPETPKPTERQPAGKSQQETSPPRQPVQEARAPTPGSAGSEGRPGHIVTDIRSSLRGGGGGGAGPAGGLGSGRGGITGEPIPLDSKDPKFSDYLDKIRERIRSKWDYPCVKDERTLTCDYKSAELVIEFGILKSGKLQFIELRAASGLPIYDDYAMNAIKLASPFPEVPAAIMAMAKAGSTGIPIVAHFQYVYEVSFRTLLR